MTEFGLIQSMDMIWVSSGDGGCRSMVRAAVIGFYKSGL